MVTEVGSLMKRQAIQDYDAFTVDEKEIKKRANLGGYPDEVMVHGL